MKISDGMPRLNLSQNAKPLEKKEIQDGIKTLDQVDFTDGANNPLEILMLPSLDIPLSQTVSQALKDGAKVVVEGALKKHGKDEIGKLKYEMSMDSETKKIKVKGQILDPKTQKGTFVREEIYQKPMNPFYMYIDGTVSPDGNMQDKNEHIKVTVYSNGEISMEGKVGNLPVNQEISFDFMGNMYNEGNVAGVPFSTTLTPDFYNNEMQISGYIGQQEEEGKIAYDSDGNIIIDRQIGEYHLIEKVKFIDKKKG